MTNALQIATMVMVGYVTNNPIVLPPMPPGTVNIEYRTNIISAVIELTPPGLPTVTNTLPVATNVVRLTIFAETLPTERGSVSRSASANLGAAGHRPALRPLTAPEADALGLPPPLKGKP